MHVEKKIKLSSFVLKKNPQAKGCYCNLCKDKFIDYNEDCYIHPNIKIIICKDCRKKERKPLKYHNKPEEYANELYDSRFEVRYAKLLDLQKRSGLIKAWKRQVKIEFNIKIINGNPILTSEPLLSLKTQGIKAHHLTNYYMDFVIENNDGTEKWVECKGVESPIWKLKYKLTEILFDKKVTLEVIKEKTFNPKKLKRAAV